MLPYFLRHYGQFCESIVVYDNGSDDGSQEIVAAHPLCQLRQIESGDEYHEGTLLEVKGQRWKESRGQADWVICCDIDEFLFHPCLLGFLEECQREGVTMLLPTGWQMVSLQFPKTVRQIYDEVQTGYPDISYSKPVIFRPDAIQEINYAPGCHTASPVGTVKERSDAMLKLLHFRFLEFDYVVSRYAEMSRRSSQYNRLRGYGTHYFQSAEQLEAQFAECLLKAQPVPFNHPC